MDKKSSKKSKVKRLRLVPKKSSTEPELEALRRELAEALEQQTATSEILRVISASPTDLQPVFDAIAESSMHLCGALFSSVYRFDGELIHMVAHHNYPPVALERSRQLFPTRPGRHLFTARAILDRSVIHVADVAQDPEHSARDIADIARFRSVLSVPMLRGGDPIGAITVWHADIGPFSQKHVALLQTFADQAVIAIENVRLFQELTEALEQQTATSQILGVIASSPTDIQPVLDTVAENAARVCGAKDGNIFRIEGDLLRLAAAYGSLPAMEGFEEGMLINRGWVTGRAVVDRKTIHVHDLSSESETEFPQGRDFARRFGHRTTLATPLLREGIPIGAILIRRAELRPFTEKQIKLLETFADQAVIAIENVRLFQELQARTSELARSVEELKALGDVGQAVSSTLDLQTVLTTIIGHAVQLSGTSGGVIYEYDEKEQGFLLRTS